MAAYITFRLLLSILLGATWYCLDRRFGVRPYRWWYGMTHEKDLPVEVQRGFVYNRDSKSRTFMALLLSVVVALAAMKWAFNPLAELLLWIISIPAIVLGFIIGPSFYRLWQRRDDVFEAIDKFESGEAEGEPAREKTGTFWGRMFGSRKEEERPVSTTTSAPPQVAETTPAPQAQVPQPEVKPESPPEPSPEEMMEKYIRERQP